MLGWQVPRALIHFLCLVCGTPTDGAPRETRTCARASDEPTAKTDSISLSFAVVVGRSRWSLQRRFLLDRRRAGASLTHRAARVTDDDDDNDVDVDNRPTRRHCALRLVMIMMMKMVGVVVMLLLR
uniref:Secreted protein n=1 Tax=Plectus sambesii TaxID=2011161 RepID=A0A914WA93_9BILA